MLTTLFAVALALADTTRGPRAPYWQQEVSYDITARLDEPSATLAGHQRIRYVNHSPDTLTTFSLHLHLNAFRPGSRWSEADARGSSAGGSATSRIPTTRSTTCATCGSWARR